jgi:hypothetical protein
MANTALAHLSETVRSRFDLPLGLRERQHRRPFESGIITVDTLLNSGFPAAALSEISGAASSTARRLSSRFWRARATPANAAPGSTRREHSTRSPPPMRAWNSAVCSGSTAEDRPSTRLKPPTSCFMEEALD